MTVDTHERARPSPGRGADHAAEPPLIAKRLQEAYAHWWASVRKVHEVLEIPGGTVADVTERFDNEFTARREYATLLLGAGRDVPDYLSAEKTFPPLWPVPQPPAVD